VKDDSRYCRKLIIRAALVIYIATNLLRAY